jgi:hypothetical protein
MDGISRQPIPRRGPRPAGRALLAACAVLLAGLALPARAYTLSPRAGAGPPAVQGGWTAAVPVVDPGCQPDLGGTAAAGASGATIHGFAHWPPGEFTDCRDDRVWYFQGRRARWTQSRSPYRGDVLAAAADRTGTYLLYLGRGSSGLLDQVLLGKRLHDGRYLPARRLSRLAGTAVNSGVFGAALVAAQGRWWAVWAQARNDPRSSSPPTFLFQAKTIGGTQAARRITFTPDQDTLPALALRRDGHGRVTGALLAWSHGVFVPSRQGGLNVENDDIRLAHAGRSGRWSSRVVSRGSYDLQLFASLAQVGRRTYLAWDRQSPDIDPRTSRVRFTDDPSGATPPHVFATPGGVPKLAGKGKTVYLMWQTLDPNTMVVARRKAATWTGQTVRVTPGTTQFQVPLLLTVSGGKLTALVLSGEARNRVFAVSQP